jgi:hypothetical protein
MNAKTHWDSTAHFIGSRDCHFGMADVVNGVIVSTCGDYRPGGKLTSIGYQRHYETMVFKDSGKRCDESGCDCGGLPLADNYTELDFEGYESAAAATEGHRRVVEKWRKEPRP